MKLKNTVGRSQKISHREKNIYIFPESSSYNSLQKRDYKHNEAVKVD